jgi:hypothetical protein
VGKWDFNIGIKVPLLPAQTTEKGKILSNSGTFFPHRGKKVSQMASGKR